MSNTTQGARTDQPINWDNVAVESEVMLRLQKAPPAVQANPAEVKPQA